MIYNKKDEYEENVLPQLNKLKKLCIKHGIPFFFAACVANNETDSVYIKDVYSGLSKGLELKQDFFPDFVKITLGFETVFPRDKIELEPESDSIFDFINELESEEST